MSARGSEGASTEQSLYLASGTTAPLLFDVVPLQASLRVAAENTNTLIYVDGSYVGKGAWQGVVPAGRHVVQLRRPSGETLQQVVDVAAGTNYSIRDNNPSRREAGPQANTQPQALSVPGQPTNANVPAAGGGDVRDGPYRGWFGTLFAPVLLGGASTNSYNDICPATAFGGGTCTTGGPRGGALAGQLGYSYGWIAPQGMLALSLDMSSAGFTMPPDISIPGDVNGMLAQVAANTKFLRLGIMAGAGARVSTQAQGHRFTFSGIFGLVKRHIYIIPDSFFSSKPSYTAPTLFFDTGVMIGDSPGIKVYAGLFFWFEFVPHMLIDRDVTKLGLQRESVPASLRVITPFSGTQLMFGPFVGATFGH